MEVGLWDAQVDRWLEKKFQDNNNVKTTDAIGMDQVVLVNAVMCCGAIIAFIILIIEKIVYAYKVKQSWLFLLTPLQIDKKFIYEQDFNSHSETTISILRMLVFLSHNF